MSINYSYPAGCGVCLGVFHILFGIASCGSGIAAIVYKTYLYDIGVGIWAGALFILTGVLGLVSGSRKSSVVTAYYVLSLISVFVAMGLMGVFGYAIYEAMYHCDLVNDDYFPSWFDDYSCPHFIEMLTLCITGSSVGFFEWIMSMSSSCASCSCCCNNSQPPAQTIVIHDMQPMPQAAQQSMYSGQPGYGMPPPGQGQFAAQAAPPSYSEKPFNAATVLDPQDYNNPTAGLPQQAGAPLPNMANMDGDTKILMTSQY